MSYLTSDKFTDSNCEWCDIKHGGLYCPIMQQTREDLMYKTSFIYTLPSSQDVYVYATAKEITPSYLEGLEISFFSMEGDPIDLIYSREVFEDIEDQVHEILYDEKGDTDESKEVSSKLSGTNEGSSR